MRAKSFCCLYKRSAVRTRQFSRRMLKGDGRFGSLDLLHFSISVALSLYSFSLKVSEFLSAPAVVVPDWEPLLLFAAGVPLVP